MERWKEKKYEVKEVVEENGIRMIEQWCLQKGKAPFYTSGANTRVFFYNFNYLFSKSMLPSLSYTHWIKVNLRIKSSSLLSSKLQTKIIIHFLHNTHRPKLVKITLTCLNLFYFP